MVPARVVVGGQVDTMAEQPVVAGQAGKAGGGFDIADPLGHMDMDADAEVVGQPCRFLE